MRTPTRLVAVVSVVAAVTTTVVATAGVGPAASDAPLPLREALAQRLETDPPPTTPARMEATLHGPDARLAAAAEDADATVLGSADGVLHVEVDTDQIDDLAAAPGVDAVAPAARLHPAVTSQGVASTGASAWHGAGIDGTGVQVAIVDVGFGDYEASLGTELPAAEDIHTSFSECSAPLNDEHGTAVAEVVHDMAPGATLHLICVDSTLDINDPNRPVFQYLRNNGIDVANFSAGSFLSSRGDGNGPVARAMAQSRRDGTLWTVAAGNIANGHALVPAGTGRTTVTGGGLQAEAVDLNPGSGKSGWIALPMAGSDGNSNTAELYVEVKWDSWPIATSDFDLYVFSSAQLADPETSPALLGWSTFNQADESLPPIEVVGISNPGAARTVYLFIHPYDAPTTPRIDLFAHNATSPIQFVNRSGSVADPATSASVLAVGAACHLTSTVQSYSGRGPTIDGRVKPDLAGPDATASSVYGTGGSSCDSAFTGTSAAAPHAAGAAALLKQATPSLDAGELHALVTSRALDAGPAGRDNDYGWGNLRVGAAGSATPPVGSRFVGASPPVRLLDTRTGNQPLGSGEVRSLQVAGLNGVPANATAVALNVTAIKPTRDTYVTVYPNGAARPNASNLNVPPNRTIANSVTVGVGSDGRVALFNYTGSTNLVVDLAGWYGPGATTGFESLAPIRAVDTRPGRSARILPPGGAFGGTEVLTVQLAGNPEIPEVPATAESVVVNVTATQPTASSHLTVWPAGLTRPTASNVNFSAGQTVANLAVVRTGTDGAVSFHTPSGKVHVAVDIVGFFDPAGAGRFVPLPTVQRILDTRSQNGAATNGFGAFPNATVTIEAAGFHGLPFDAVGAATNVTAIGATAGSGHLAVWGTGPMPSSSTVNFVKGAVVPNAALVSLGQIPGELPGRISVSNRSNGLTHVVVDISGYFVEP